LDVRAHSNVVDWAKRIETIPGFSEPLRLLAREDMDFGFAALGGE
jgi:hypothetical protein